MKQERFHSAPFFADVADGPENAEAFWVTAKDGVRLRIGVWPSGSKGTVFLLPGRTEYIEKYGRAAGDLVALDYAVISIDWRGQGLADRALTDRMTGHVGRFDEYQDDVAAMLHMANRLGLPTPYYMLSHSMGGCIGLRALVNRLPFKAAAFSAPMWGILMAAWMRPVAMVVSQVSGWVGQRHRFAPGTSEKSYVADAAFAGNVLTTDPEMWRYMRRQIMDHPELSLGGPSLGWLSEALSECALLSLAPSPAIPAITGLGTAEKVVDPAPIHMRMSRWQDGRLDIYQGAEHEIIMETPAHRERFFASAAKLFDENP
ncbi:alpha/beta fold hydrolase [Thioclava sp. FR2]|uniref:alpha/beta fold hydrolase n=1 Tax=Thioclava sp. FR2 TaxID=3445780 RepID=UPI003EBBD55E